jgi:type IV secretion system protein VirB1
LLPGIELFMCPNLAVSEQVMQHVVRVESSYNPYAIGVVGGHLVRQPKNLPEALATVQMLESRGYNFSLGLAQVNRYNLKKYGLNSYENAFEICPNLQAGSKILAECYGRHRDWGKSFSCYYSGNSVTGFRHGYVQKIYASMRQDVPGTSVDGQASPIEVVSKPSRKVVGVTRHPVYAASAKPIMQQRIEPALPAPAMQPSVAALAGQPPAPVVPQIPQQVAAVQVSATQAAVPASAVPVDLTQQQIKQDVDNAFVF